jgi:hypothetical protein
LRDHELPESERKRAEAHLSSHRCLATFDLADRQPCQRACPSWLAEDAPLSTRKAPD